MMIDNYDLVIERGKENGKLKFFDMNVSPYERFTLPATITAYLTFGFFFGGCSQTVAQRIASVPTKRDARG